MLGLILSILGVGGIGTAAAAIFFPAFGGVLGGLLKSAWSFIKSIPWQVWVGLAVVAVIAFLFISRSHWIDRAHGDEAQLAEICQMTRVAANRPRLDCKQAGKQIKFLGEAVTKLKAAIDHQNAAVDAWKAEAARQQAAATEARKVADKRAGRAESVAERAKASAAKAPPAGAPCEPSEIMKESWQ